MSSNPHKLAKLLTDPTASWCAENAQIADSSPTFSDVSFAPESIASYLKCSRELIQDSVNIEEMLTNAFIKAIAEKIDYACFLGSGSSNIPECIANYSSLSYFTAVGTNGTALADYGQISFIAHSRVDIKPLHEASFDTIPGIIP